MLCGFLGIFLNVLLFAGKFMAGTLSGSIAITADAFNNLSDAGSSVVTLLGFKLAQQKPDAEHPYGHGRMEYIAGFIVSALILAMAFSLLKDSFVKVLHPEGISFSWLIVGILIASILVKCYMAFYNHSIGKKYDSATIRATALDSLSDCVSTAFVLAATLIAHFTGCNLDGWFGLLVGLFVAYSGLTSCRDTINPLLGQAPEREFVRQIEDVTMHFDSHIRGMHDLLVHDYGPGRRFISLHAEVPAEDDVVLLHDIIDNLERKLREEFGCLATVHMDPVVTADSRIEDLKERVRDCLKQVNEDLKFHDFRVVFGESHNNLLFDVLAPMNYKASDAEIKAAVQEEIHRNLGEEYYCVIEVDRDYT